MTVEYKPKGVCARAMTVHVNSEHIIESIEVIGGCNGNLKGIANLVKGMRAEDAIERMKGVTCGNKPTSCPDQISIALEQALAEMA